MDARGRIRAALWAHPVLWAMFCASLDLLVRVRNCEALGSRGRVTANRSVSFGSGRELFEYPEYPGWPQDVRGLTHYFIRESFF